MFCVSYVYLFNLRWTGLTSPQPIVGRVYPSTLAFYPSKGRVDGSLDEAVGGGQICLGLNHSQMVSGKKGVQTQTHKGTLQLYI